MAPGRPNDRHHAGRKSQRACAPADTRQIALSDMRIVATPLPEVLIIEPLVFGDERGFFYESFNHQAFMAATGLDVQFVQDNHSHSRRGVLRGLHYQLQQAQGKLVRTSAGEIYDVAVDLRRSSPHFGRWFGLHLSADNKRQLWIPPGFGHGFLALSEHAEYLYKTTHYYTPEHERCIAWNDPDLAIDWPMPKDLPAPLLSPKDAAGTSLRDAEVYA